MSTNPKADSSNLFESALFLVEEPFIFPPVYNSRMDKALRPDPPLLDHPLIPIDAFKDKLKAILSVKPKELSDTMAAHPLPPQKRGPKPKSTAH